MAVKKRVTAENVVDLLNELVSIDKEAMTKLIMKRVECNEGLASHDTVQVIKTGETYQVGMLGILNGLFGVDERGYGPICVELSSSNHIVEFKKLNV